MQDRTGSHEIKCVFFSEFHPHVGPKISCQYPEDFISKEQVILVSFFTVYFLFYCMFAGFHFLRKCTQI